MYIVEVIETVNEQNEKNETLNPYSNFLYALKSPEVRRQYPKLLKIFLDTIKFELDKPLEERVYLLFQESVAKTKWLETKIIRFVEYQKQRVERKEIAAGTLKNYVKVIKLFCQMNEIENLVLWKKIKIGMPKVKEQADDRAPTLEEIRKLIEYPDIRVKPIVFTMISSGIRIGAWDYLRWKHIIPIEKDGKIVAAKIIVYAGEPEQYFSFISPEAYNSLKEWIDYRASYGERINGNSWLTRDIWQKTHHRYSHRIGLAAEPKQLKSTAIKKMISSMWQVVGVRNQLDQGQKRHEFKGVHGFRKFFETHCQLVMNHNNIKMLMAHSLGESGNYHRPTETQLLEDYLKAVELLTINEENRLYKRINELQEKNMEKDYVIRGKLQEKDEQINQLISKQEKFEQLIQSMIDSGQLKPKI
ncbi:MAG TPA: hypothetical protein VFP49_11205 [Nitrososphaeraceae archaeon]|nr:hypothetical protein [Nitrososphaeraceae archaeon]